MLSDFIYHFIWPFVNPIETETGPEPETERGLVTFGWSLFARFSVSTVGLEPSEVIWNTYSQKCMELYFLCLFQTCIYGGKVKGVMMDRRDLNPGRWR